MKDVIFIRKIALGKKLPLLLANKIISKAIQSCCTHVRPLTSVDVEGVTVHRITQ